MPTAYVKKMADRHGISVTAAEEKWEKAKQAAENKFKHGTKRYWPYVMGIFKKMMGLKEQVSFKEFVQLEELFEAKKEPSIPEGTRKLLKELSPGGVIMLKKGYYLEFNDVKPIKATYNVRRLVKDIPEDEHIYMTVSRRGGVGGKYMLQMHGEPLHGLSWEQRSKFGTLDEVKPFDKDSLKQFANQVMSTAGVITEEKKEDGVKKSYLKGLNAAEKKEMKQEIKRFSKMDHKDKNAYPDDWTADQKYKERLKKKDKKLPKSEHTKEFERRYGK